MNPSKNEKKKEQKERIHQLDKEKQNIVWS